MSRKIFTLYAVAAVLSGVGYAGYRTYRAYVYAESFALRDCDRRGYCAPGER